MSAQVFDAQTPLHFGVGLAAGALGVDPHVATLTFIAARVIGVAVDTGLNQALFVPQHGHSAAKEIADLAVEVLGIYLGKLVRDRYQQPPPAAAPPPPLTGYGQLPAPGACADGSGNWLPLVGTLTWVPVCPSSPWYPLAVSLNQAHPQVTR